jgi:hypothetical protein
MTKAVIGIDPGANGAATIVTANAVHSFGFKDKSWPDIVIRLTAWGSVSEYNFIEAVSAMPKDGAHNAFTFGENTGIIKGIFHALDMRFVEVHSQKWQRHFGLGAKFESKKARKHAQREKAQEFCKFKVTLDIADSILIAKYGYDKMFS